MTRFAVEPLYGSVWLAVLAAIAIVAIIVLVTPPTDDPRRRKWLVLLRSAAAFVLLIAAMRPAIVRTDNRPAPATLMVAIDTSKSMKLPDGGGTDRWSTQQAAAKELLDGIRSLDESLTVSLLKYDSESTPLVLEESPTATPRLTAAIDGQAPVGDATDLGRGLRGAIDVAAGKPIAGVVLLGDGTQTTSGDSTGGDLNRDASAALRSAQVLDALGIPLWTVPVGPPSSDDAARDVAVTGLPESLQLFADNQFELSFAVQATGLANRQLPVEVSWVDENGTKTPAKSRQVSARGASETIAVSLPMTAPKPGIYRLQVEAAPQSGEWVTSNNAQTAFVEVREGGGRILVLEGTGRPEQTFLRRALKRFPDLQLDYAPIRNDQSWPVPLQEVLMPNRFDIYVIGDLDSAAFGDEQLRQLADRIAAGASLITLGGFQAYSTGGYADGPLADVLPIKMDAGLRRPPPSSVLTPEDKQVRSEAQLDGPITVVPARNHPIVNLGAGSETIWKELPELSGANRFIGPKVASGVQVLLRSDRNEPLLVVGGYGKGRVASLAIDETYRWWRAGKADVHRRFWRQLMLWLMSREESNPDSVVAELDRRRFEAGETPEFRAALQSLETDPGPVSLSAVIVDAAGVETPLEFTASSVRGPAISGSLPTLESGFYTLVARASEDRFESDRIAFQVTETSRELARPAADHLYMKQLADLTASHGGATFDPQDMNSLVDTITSKRRSAQTPVVEKKRLGDGPLSGWIVFGLFAGLLSVEWTLRRRWGMA